MNIINLTEKQISSMPIIGSGGCAQIRLLNFSEVAKIYGIDKISFFSYESDEEKIELIHQLHPIQNLILPNKKIYVEERYTGFSMDHVKSSKQLIYTKFFLPLLKRIEILIMIKNILLKMFKQDFFMVDLNEFNILIKKVNLIPYVIDVDGAAFGKDNLDIVLEKYYHLCLQYIFDNIDFGLLFDYSQVEANVKYAKRREALNKCLHQLRYDINQIEKVRELVLKYDKPYLNATF